MEIKAIETEYKGYKFRSRLEARWAVFFDACGVKWEYEPEGFYCGNGVLYLPDFILHDVYIRGKEKSDLWVEVKGVMTKEDARKILEFYRHNKILVVNKIPNGKCISQLFNDVDIFRNTNTLTYGTIPFSFDLVDFEDISTALFICLKNGTVSLSSKCRAIQEIFESDEKKTVHAYDLARQARFEQSADTKTYSAEEIKTLLAFIEPSKLSYYNWLTVAHVVKNQLQSAGVNDSSAFEIFDEWCARDSSVNAKGKPRYNRNKNKKHWDSMNGSRFSINSLKKLAENH